MAATGLAGVVLYGKDIERLTQFYTQVLGLQEQHRESGWVVLAAAAWQLELHAIPAHIAARMTITAPPQRRENVALKFFAAVPSLADAGAVAESLGGALLQDAWAVPVFRACNAMDCEGNVIPLRELTSAAAQ